MILEILQEALYELNPELDSEVMEATFRKVSYIDETDLVKANRSFHRYLLEGVRIDVYGEDAPTRIVKLIDFEKPEFKLTENQSTGGDFSKID